MNHIGNTFITKMNFSHCEPPAVSERMWSVNKSINFRRELDPRRAFQAALGVTRYLDDWYRSTMCVIVISLGKLWSAGQNFRCTWECRQTNAEITSKLWGMSWLLWIFIQRTADIIWDSPDVHNKSISLHGEYDAWIIVHYHFWIKHAIFFNIVFVPHYIEKPTKQVTDWTIHTGTIIQWPHKRSNDINQTCCQCHPLHPPSHRGRWKQEHTIHQRSTAVEGAPCVCQCFIPRE